MTTEHDTTTSERPAAIDPTPDGSVDALDEVEAAIETLDGLDAADAVGPLADITATLNRELDHAQETS